MLKDFKRRVREKFSIGLKVNPNLITLVGLIACLVAGIFFAWGELFVGAVFILLGGFFDVLDGAVARECKKETKFGAFIDSVSDRIGEGGIIIGAMWGGYTAFWIFPDWFIGALALLTSFMVSYARARAECIGISMESVGIGERAERMVIVAMGAFLNVLNWAFVVLVIISTITILQRIFHARKVEVN
ncbi:CDP-alcohol phosphatidyltransferase family protein [Methanosarcinales archaeon]|nr:MAG: CDP-alcohol phosphatidyltransferase family protein [Methanosarcinales archaeon]